MSGCYEWGEGAVSENIRAVSIGEIIASDAPDDVLVAYGLGSCVAICLYDPVVRVGGMLHALLPTALNEGNRGDNNPVKYVDRGTPLLVGSLLKLGARRGRLIGYLCGGAQVLTALDLSDFLNIGERNVRAAESALSAENIHIRARSTGGYSGRTVRLYVSDGRVTAKSLEHGEQTIDSLADSGPSARRASSVIGKSSIVVRV